MAYNNNVNLLELLQSCQPQQWPHVQRPLGILLIPTPTPAVQGPPQQFTCIQNFPTNQIRMHGQSQPVVNVPRLPQSQHFQASQFNRIPGNHQSPVNNPVPPSSTMRNTEQVQKSLDSVADLNLGMAYLSGLSRICGKYPQLRSGLVHIEKIFRIFQDVQRDIMIPEHQDVFVAHAAASPVVETNKKRIKIEILDEDAHAVSGRNGAPADMEDDDSDSDTDYYSILQEVDLTDE